MKLALLIVDDDRNDIHELITEILNKGDVPIMYNLSLDRNKGITNETATDVISLFSKMDYIVIATSNKNYNPLIDFIKYGLEIQNITVDDKRDNKSTKIIAVIGTKSEFDSTVMRRILDKSGEDGSIVIPLTSLTGGPIDILMLKAIILHSSKVYILDTCLMKGDLWAEEICEFVNLFKNSHIPWYIAHVIKNEIFATSIEQILVKWR